MSQARTQTARPRRSGDRTEAAKLRGKVAITLRLDAERVAQLQALAEAENRSLTDHVETAVLRGLSRREEAERVITMYVAPGVSDSIRPEDVVRAKGESDEGYAERQMLTVELWSIPHNARPSLKGLLLADEGRGDIRLLPRGRRRTRKG